MNKKLKLEELGRIDAEAFKASKKIPLIVWLNNIRSLANIGSLFRTADAFRVEEIWCQGITATPPHREINKTALGATQTVAWRYFEKVEDVFNEIEKQKLLLLTLEQTEKTKPLSTLTVSSSQRSVICLGNEVEGVDQSIVDASHTVFEIPQHGTKHSLNVTISGGIFIWEFYKKLIERDPNYFSKQSHPARS